MTGVRTGARWLVGLALVWVASCNAATPKPEHASLRPSARPSTKRPAHVRIEREIYSGKLLFLLRHGWREPADLRVPPMSLRTTAVVEISPEGMFVHYRLERSSGNPLFDQSVTETLTVLFTGPPAPGTPPY